MSEAVQGSTPPAVHRLRWALSCPVPLRQHRRLWRSRPAIGVACDTSRCRCPPAEICIDANLQRIIPLTFLGWMNGSPNPDNGIGFVVYGPIALADVGAGVRGLRYFGVIMVEAWAADNHPSTT